MGQKFGLPRPFKTGDEVFPLVRRSPDYQHMHTGPHKGAADHCADALGPTRHDGGFSGKAEQFVEDVAHLDQPFAMLKVCRAV